jgi:hypothetical protein
MLRMGLSAILLSVMPLAAQGAETMASPTTNAVDAAKLSPSEAAQMAFGQLAQTIGQSESDPERGFLDQSRRLRWMKFYARPHAAYPGLCMATVYDLHFAPTDGLDDAAEIKSADRGRTRPVRADYMVAGRRYFVVAPEDLSRETMSEDYAKELEASCTSLKGEKGFFPIDSDTDFPDRFVWSAARAMQKAQASVANGTLASFALHCHASRNQSECADPAKVLTSLAFDRISKVTDCSRDNTPCYQLEFGPIDWHVWGTWILKITSDKTSTSVDLSQSNIMNE